MCRCFSHLFPVVSLFSLHLVNLWKCLWAKPETHYLGYQSSSSVLSRQSWGIKNPRSQTKKQLEFFLGLVGWYQWFISEYLNVPCRLLHWSNSVAKRLKTQWNRVRNVNKLSKVWRMNRAPHRLCKDQISITSFHLGASGRFRWGHWGCAGSGRSWWRVFLYSISVKNFCLIKPDTPPLKSNIWQLSGH